MVVRVKSKNRLDPGAILHGLFAGQTPDSETLARVLSELTNPESRYDSETLIKILAWTNYQESIPFIRGYFLKSEDPFVVFAAMNALFGWWSEDPNSSMYSERVRMLSSGLEWDPDELVANAARML